MRQEALTTLDLLRRPMGPTAIWYSLWRRRLYQHPDRGREPPLTASTSRLMVGGNAEGELKSGLETWELVQVYCYWAGRES